MAILRHYSSSIEQASIDEAYFQLQFPIFNFQFPNVIWNEAGNIARTIKEEIKMEEKLTCSIGIGSNKLIAKIASDFKKPDGLTIVTDEEKESFLEPMPIRKIPGIGPKTEIRFRTMGILTVRDLKQLSEPELTDFLGKWGKDLYQKARGIDDSPLEPFSEPKSIGEQETFLEDTLDSARIISTLTEMARRVIQRMGTEGFSGYRTIGIIVRFSGFETKTRSHTLPTPSKSTETLKFEALKLLMPFLDRRENPRNKKIRLVGLRIEKLTSLRTA